MRLPTLFLLIMSTILENLHGVAKYGDDAYGAMAIGLCIATDEASNDVCEGLMSLKAPSMAHSLRNMDIPSRTSTMFCNALFGLCDLPAVSNYTLPIPPSKSTGSHSVTTRTRAPIQVVHISDIHVDLTYEVGTTYNCTEEICCSSFVTEDAPNATMYPAGPWGNHACDFPLDLELSLYNAIRVAVPNASFTLFTGDIVEGAEWLTTDQEIVNDINSAYDHMVLNGLDLVYAAVGNHEANPVNSFPIPDASIPANQSHQYMYDTLASNWQQWVGTSAASSAASHGGLYAVLHPNSNLKVISWNTMFIMKENFWLYTPNMSTDSARQFSWLVAQLQAAEDAAQHVWIIGQIPPGRPDFMYDYSYFFDQIVQRYHATIAAHFCAQSAATANAVHYVAPALTPTSGNPTFRVYSVDLDSWQVLDYTVYVANMSAPAYQTDGPQWRKYYSVKEAYGSLLDPPITDPRTPLTPLCSGTMASEICQMRSSQAQYACYAADASVSIKAKKKRDATGAVVDSRGDVNDDHGAECPRSRLIRAFRRARII
ncbi:Metallo-dependent phosphatase-like protein [Xylariales sp. PMI_506]|nr:Metallo-dependent phosphatase-like protein [Xylariales sp. PMI_506]